MNLVYIQLLAINAILGTTTIFPILVVDCFCSNKPSVTDTNVTIQNSFPLNEFLHSTGLLPDIYWEGFRCFDQSYGTTCDCDPSCQSTAQCCIDFMWNHTEAVTQTKILANPRSLVNRYKKGVLGTSTKNWNCLPLFPFSSLNVSFLMIDSCLPNANDKDKDLCILERSSSLSKREQMSVLGADGILYKNR